MTLLTSITESYLQKSQPFFESTVKYWPGRRICFTIGFAATIEGWETIQVEPKHTWRPKNRKDYYSLQHGEFTEHIKFDPHEMLCFVDSDMILQRQWDIQCPATDAVIVTQCSWPQLRLMEVVKNLKCKRRGDKFLEKYKCSIQKEFCACFIAAKAYIWNGIYHQAKLLYPMLKDFDHHAAWQLLLNTAISNTFKVVICPEHFVNAEWYNGTNAKAKDGQLFVDVIGNRPDEASEDDEQQSNSVLVNELVYFNHYKFNGEWKF